MRTVALVVLTSVLAGAGCASCGPQADGCSVVSHDALPAASAPLEARVVVSGLEVPWALAFAERDGAVELFVTERAGRVRRVTLASEGGDVVGALEEGNAVVGTLDDGRAALDVAQVGEGGLLGLALAPDFATSSALFTYRTRPDGAANVIERWVLERDASGAPAALVDGRVLVDDIPANRNHDGGRLRIGPDGHLWASTGDAQEPALSRDRASLAGKLLRMTLDGAPVDGDDDLVALTGIRNSQGFAFVGGGEGGDGVDVTAAGALVVTDHGPSGELARFGHDELNVATLGDDLGWPDAHACAAVDGVRAPLLVFDEALPPGGVAVRSEGAADDQGARRVAFVTALGARKLVEVDLDTGEAVVHLDGTHGRLRDVVVGLDGALWVTTSNCDGRGDCPADGDAILRLTR